MAESNIYEKLRKVQVELKVPKNQRNSFGNYNYRSAEDIIEAAKPVLDEHGLTLVVTDGIVLIGDRYYVHAEAYVLDGGSESIAAEGFAREDETKKGMDGAQITGAASSYARKYALNGLLAIDDTKDADSDEHRRQAVQTVPVRTVKPAVGTAQGPAPTAAERTLVTEAQVKLLLARARDASGLTDRQEIYDWFLKAFGLMPNEVKRADVDRVLKDMSVVKEPS